MILLEICRPKMQNLGLKTPILGKFSGKIEILSTRNHVCRKFAAVCRKIATFSPPTFLTHDAAVKCAPCSPSPVIWGLVLCLQKYFKIKVEIAHFCLKNVQFQGYSLVILIFYTICDRLSHTSNLITMIILWKKVWKSSSTRKPAAKLLAVTKK